MADLAVKDLDDGFGHWLAGFIDGEGCFGIQIIHNTYVCVFTVMTRADDAEVLHTIAERLGFGGVTINHPPTARNPRATFYVRSKADCLALVEVLDRYPLRAKKAQDYAIWRDAVLDSQVSGRGRDWESMAQSRDELMKVRAFSG